MCWRCANCFRPSEASWRIPTLLLFSGFGMAAGGWLAGLLYDHFGYYAPAFAAGIGANILNSLVVGDAGAARSAPSWRRSDARRRRRRGHAFGTILNICIAVHLARVGEQRLHRGDEGVMLLARSVHGSRSPAASMALRELMFFLDASSALERDRIRHRLTHGALQIVRPGIERSAMQEDRPRNIEVRASACGIYGNCARHR